MLITAHRPDLEPSVVWTPYTTNALVCQHTHLVLAFFPGYVQGLVTLGPHGDLPTFYLPVKYCHECGIVCALGAEKNKVEEEIWSGEESGEDVCRCLGPSGGTEEVGH